ncbi:hypothetical protein ACPWT1_21415 [Ramlibacter sp. MMS24-I3-19]|uniref:hypothetical protein n=1 Tax=Ramlibacter sp. MMS24-I3-19 TaxID=3416606 RepID=UPI003D060AF9
MLRDRSPAFADGAWVRAARYLGDAGESAAERWDAAFHPDRAQVWIALHGPDAAALDAAVTTLRGLRGAQGLSGWDQRDGLPDGQQLLDANDAAVRRVHFGFRDNLTKPSILDRHRRLVEHGHDGGTFMPRPGELLLGHANNDGADLWTSEATPDDVADLLRNGSFGVLRKIEQHVDRFHKYLDAEAARLQAQGHTFATREWLKAKMCGRWANGAPVLPGETREPVSPSAQRIAHVDFEHDADGQGCPFGAHIRRANPRTDPLRPPRNGTLFRRGIPYGAPGDGEVGLFGLFFCARIEDQFEHLVSEWLEKNPMGPPNRGRAKDPLSGQHDDPDAQFHIPLPHGKRITLDGMRPFVRTRGTLYALFPSRTALEAIAIVRQQAAAPPLQQKAAARSPGAQPRADVAPDALDAPVDRFCDVVMEGGITSGIIYASAISELAGRYRFARIGGSSIGAFAAALAAAAEYRRRQGSGDGFARLARLPGKLAQVVDGRTLLERLFVPQQRTRRLFHIFLATLEHRSVLAAVLSGLAAALWQYRWPVAVTTLALAAIVLAGPVQTASLCWGAQADASCVWPLVSWTTALLLTVGVGVVAALVAGIGWDSRALVANGFGLCRGCDPKAAPDAIDLAGFLHEAIQELAGRDVAGKPLTFRDLWDAPGSAAQALGITPRGTAPSRSINLEVYSSNLAHNRPYRFPLDEAEDMGRLFFRTEELEDYFPKGLVQYLATVSSPYARRSEDDPHADKVGPGYLELPVAELPIVVAARLAMSFPLLISAVPLHAVNYRTQAMTRCWMSDGGLCSNFPIHLFDSFLPMWPTFGISLGSRANTDEIAVELPRYHTGGRADTWDLATGAGHRTPFSFVSSVWRTTWRWNDSTMMRMPGVRDRVVRLYLLKEEGGVNIRMPPRRIERLGCRYGTPAARAFIAKFQAPDSPGWHEHRWVRLNCLLISMRDRICNFGNAVELDRHTIPLKDQLQAALSAAPLTRPQHRCKPWPSEDALSTAAVDELRALVDALCQLEKAFLGAGTTEPYRAIPRSSLRMRHPT